VSARQERYRHIAAALETARLPFTVPFVYLERGIQVHGQWYPAVKMEWVEGQTRLVLLPAPCWNPTWMPAVVQFPAEIFQGMPFCQPLRLQGSGLTLEIDGFRDLAASPAAFDGPKHKSLREWLLDIMHLQGMAWVASPIGMS